MSVAGLERSMQEDPRTLFDMHVSHIGINASNAEESLAIAKRFEELMFLPVSETPRSHFAGTFVEVMNGNGRGEKGHIGFHVNDVKAAATWFDAHGFEIDQDSWTYKEDGSVRLVYFKEQIGGFAIHLTAGE
jgi:catechol 2,3-dioxygenase-like lactoylglutathione lyase family enzyme